MPVKVKTLTGTHGIALTIACGFAFSLVNRYHGGVSVFGSVHTVTAGAGDGEGLVGRINFEHVVTFEVQTRTFMLPELSWI